MVVRNNFKDIYRYPLKSIIFRFFSLQLTINRNHKAYRELTQRNLYYCTCQTTMQHTLWYPWHMHDGLITYWELTPPSKPRHCSSRMTTIFNEYNVKTEIWNNLVWSSIPLQHLPLRQNMTRNSYNRFSNMMSATVRVSRKVFGLYLMYWTKAWYPSQ